MHPMTNISLKLHNLHTLKKPPISRRFFVILVLCFLELENHVFSKLLVVLSEFELLSSCEVLLLYVGDVSHDP